MITPNDNDKILIGIVGNQDNVINEEPLDIKTEEKPAQLVEPVELVDSEQTTTTTTKAITAPDVINNAENDITTTETAPSAPSAPEIEGDNDMPQMTQLSANPMYPNLKSIQSFDLAAHLQYTKERIHMRPFTFDQLKELYHNPELHMADAFETDFINTELGNTHKDHPLYELIRKYSHSRYNLKVNMLDLHGYIKCFQENAQKVWIIENRITSYEGVCADGERVRKNELYE